MSDDPSQIQFSLWDGPTPEFVAPTAGRQKPDTIEQRFQDFHSRNPWVYAALVRLARDLRRNGQQRCGIKMLFEVIRWQWSRETTASDGFRLNNSLTSRFARLIMEQEPDLEGFFDVRELKAA